jgi:hypothetical protein
MHLDREPGALDLAMCIAAFGFIAGVLVFAHPALMTIRTANAPTAKAAAAVTAAKPIGTTLSGLAAPR